MMLDFHMLSNRPNHCFWAGREHGQAHGRDNALYKLEPRLTMQLNGFLEGKGSGPFEHATGAVFKLYKLQLQEKHSPKGRPGTWRSCLISSQGSTLAASPASCSCRK